MGKLPEDMARQSNEKMCTALGTGPQAAKEFGEWGRTLSDKNQNRESSDKLRRACELNPELLHAYSAWGWSLYWLTLYSEAGEKFAKVIELDPDDEEGRAVEAYQGWGWTLRLAACYGEAAAKFQKALAVDPNNESARRGLGVVFYEQKQYDRSANEYQVLAEADGSNVRAFLGWGEALLGQGKDSQAAEKYGFALAIDSNAEPRLADRYYYWGNALASQKRLGEAVEKYRRAAELAGETNGTDADENPNRAYALMNRAAYLGDMGRYREYWSGLHTAVEAYEKGLSTARQRGDTDYLRYYAAVLKELGDLEKGRTALPRGPGHRSRPFRYPSRPG